MKDERGVTLIELVLAIVAAPTSTAAGEVRCCRRSRP